MTKEEAIDEIIRLCEAEEGFLVQLRVFAHFDQELYQQLVDAFHKYTALVDKDETIHRRATGYLFDFVSLLDSTCFHFEKRHHPDTEKLFKAFDEALGIVATLFR